VHHELEAPVERSDEELSPPLHPEDPATGCPFEILELAWDARESVPPHVLDRSTSELGIELAAHGFDLGKLRHEPSLGVQPCTSRARNGLKTC
jgi:hypothetical protein